MMKVNMCLFSKQVGYGIVYLVLLTVVCLGGKLWNGIGTAAAASSRDITILDENETKLRIQQQEQEQQTTDNDNNDPFLSSVPYAIVHIGPHKTGSTTIQYEAAGLTKELLLDHYELPSTGAVRSTPNHFRLAHCLKNETELMAHLKMYKWDFNLSVAKRQEEILLQKEQQEKQEKQQQEEEENQEQDDEEDDEGGENGNTRKRKRRQRRQRQLQLPGERGDQMMTPLQQYNLQNPRRFPSTPQQQQQQQKQQQQQRPPNQFQRPPQRIPARMNNGGFMNNGPQGGQLPPQRLPVRSNANTNNYAGSGSLLNNNNNNIKKRLSPAAKARKERQTCDPTLLQATKRIADRGNGVLWSAERFSTAEVLPKLIRQVLNPWWPNVKIVAYYKRFYDWLYSWNNELNKKQHPNHRISIVKWISQPSRIDSMRNIAQGIFTTGAITRYREYFNDDQILIYNEVDNRTSNIIDDFFCHALPHANHACAATKQEQTPLTKNSARPLVYENLANQAILQKVVNTTRSHDNRIVSTLAKKIRVYQEETLGLTEFDFQPYIICPTEQELDYILQISLESEKELFPEFFASPQGEPELRRHFDIAKRTKLCTVDVAKVVELDPKWRTFLQSL